jgi:ankyrin repeat protein
VELLARHRADLDVRNQADNTALMAAAERGEVEVLRALLVDLRGGQRRSALMAAAAAGRTEAVRVLVEAGARTTLRDAAGSTAIDLAKSRGHAEVVELLEAREGGGLLSGF